VKRRFGDNVYRDRGLYLIKIRSWLKGKINAFFVGEKHTRKSSFFLFDQGGIITRG
jgi:hypothetical protein